MAKIRLNKYIADCGIASRRSAERFILQGLVKVNGDLVTELGTKIDVENDRVEVSDQLINQSTNQPVVLMLNKPAGYVCTSRKFKGEKNILDLINLEQRVYPVGRLDKDSTGLLLLTNDGDLALKLTHPRYEKEKEYEVEVDHEISSEFIDEMQQGVTLEDGTTLPAKVKQLSYTAFSIVLGQGKKRQIRRMCQELGYRVVGLNRVRINKLELGDLAVGDYRILSEKEIALLK